MKPSRRWRRAAFKTLSVISAARSLETNWIDAVQALNWLPQANARVKGVAELNWGQVVDMLNARFGWRANQNEITRLEEAANTQLAALYQTLPMQTQRCSADDRQPLRAGGW